jgi:hypothetical protein
VRNLEPREWGRTGLPRRLVRLDAPCLAVSDLCVDHTAKDTVYTRQGSSIIWRWHDKKNGDAEERFRVL